MAKTKTPANRALAAWSEEFFGKRYVLSDENIENDTDVMAEFGVDGNYVTCVTPKKLHSLLMRAYFIGRVDEAWEQAGRDLS